MPGQGEAAAEGEPSANPMVGATRTRPSLPSIDPTLDPSPDLRATPAPAPHPIPNPNHYPSPSPSPNPSPNPDQVGKKSTNLALACELTSEGTTWRVSNPLAELLGQAPPPTTDP